MKIKILVFLIACSTLFAGIKNDAEAPTFVLMNQDSEMVDLASFKGKKVILEWTNHDCPFVKKHYDTDNMQELQREYTNNNVVWLSIISSAEGKQGYVTKSEAKELTVSRNAQPSHVLFDSNGDVGRLYDAKTTPHMYVIDEKGLLRYQGAIDNLGVTGALFSTDLSKAKNYVRNAMNSLFLGEDVAEKNTRPYGCSVKY
tara:strand:- start:578 stop:1177 length:600 start_codon:yes stop_codon:yes gene_type:complete